MEYSDHVKFYERLKNQGKPSPLDNIPKLDAVSSWYIEAFRILNSGRQELNQIPLQDIFSYIDHFDIIGSKEEFIEIIQALDAEFIDYYNKIRENKTSKKRTK